MNNFEKASKCPSCIYNEPQEVLDDESTSKEQKIHILKQWEQDAHQILTADEENMAGDTPSFLNRVRVALASLEDDS